jgi:2-polyprenyl-6-methoxyphenol hydroxylase-like FAD-dependent oxidoreductase
MADRIDVKKIDRSMSDNKNAPKRIVIIGCGPGGCMVANGLSKSAATGKAEVTILEKKDHVDLCIPHPRSMVNAAFAQEVLFLCRHT